MSSGLCELETVRVAQESKDYVGEMAFEAA